MFRKCTLHLMSPSQANGVRIGSFFAKQKQNIPEKELTWLPKWKLSCKMVLVTGAASPGQEHQTKVKFLQKTLYKWKIL